MDDTNVADADGRAKAGAKTTRRAFLGAAAAGGAWIALGGLTGCEPDPRIRAAASTKVSGRVRVFRSRPDLGPPVLEVTKRARGGAPGHVFVAPKNGPGEEGPGRDGALILDGGAEPVWFRPLGREERDVMDFKAQRYRGEPVLTWWEGTHGGYGRGEYLIFDSSYREVARVRAGNGYEGDHHEFLISDRDTALLVIYGRVPSDLSSVGGPADGAALEGVVQEVDIETGEVLFEWRSLDHVGPEESYNEPRPDLVDPFDYFHINSVDVDRDENLLVSARRTSAVYKIDRETGEVIWRLGGKKSDFSMGPGARFAYQHDARRRPDGTISLFDNRGAAMEEPSRGVVLELGEDAMTATLLQEYALPDGPFAPYQGNVQTLPNGNAFVGWGSAPYVSEHDGDGKLLFEARFPPEAESYRAFRSQWKGLPRDAPVLAAEPGPEEGRVTLLYASWNGATEVATWEVLAGPSPDNLESVGPAPRKGFETVISFSSEEPFAAVRAKDHSGRVLGTSRAVEPGAAGGGPRTEVRDRV